MDHSQDNYGTNINVNLAGIGLAETRDEATANLSMIAATTCAGYDGRSA